MESIRWICIQIATGRMKQDWYIENTLGFTRKESKRYLLDGSSITWDEAVKTGFRCIKVTLAITPIL